MYRSGITLVGIKADTSPACVSVTGKAVKLHVPVWSHRLAALSKRHECKLKTSLGKASRPDGQRNNNDICRYATACLLRLD